MRIYDQAVQSFLLLVGSVGNRCISAIKRRPDERCNIAWSAFGKGAEKRH
jgi:hypothetical protein